MTQNTTIQKEVPKQVYAELPETVLNTLHTDPDKGLSLQEVKKRREQFGENQLGEDRQKHVLLLFLEQFLDPVIYVLLAAALLGFAFGEIIEGFAVLIVIVVTACIGFVMEWQAVRSMEALKKMTEFHTTVLRNGQIVTVEAHYLVPGDIIFLESGNVVPADARILTHENLAVKEAALTGESMQVEKSTEPLPPDTPLAERFNMVFNGTLITRGTAKAIVTSTGEQTELGKISQLTRQAKDDSTPIEKKLTALSKRLIWLTLFLAIFIALLGYMQGRELKQMIETAIALAVAAIPEGLPIVATIALARGMLRLARDRVIIKELQSVETLGSTGIICTDKTGTLTENQMTARSFLFQEEQLEVPDEFRNAFFTKNKEKPAFVTLIETGVLCNNVQVAAGEALHGDPVEVALIELAQDAGMDVDRIRGNHPEKVELPFDTETKMMATLNRFGDTYRVSAKGALESLLDHCDTIFADGKAAPFHDKEAWMQKADQLAARGLHTLAFAFREVAKPPAKEQLLNHLTFLGLVGFIDPPRTDVKAAIDTCHQAGIRVVMITGDHPETARSIAGEVGLFKQEAAPDKVVTGQELDILKGQDGKREERLLKAAVFARVTPTQKLELVHFYQKHQFVVGMTGDGVNDAPALKKQISASPWVFAVPKRPRKLPMSSCAMTSLPLLSWPSARGALFLKISAILWCICCPATWQRLSLSRRRPLPTSRYRCCPCRSFSSTS
jgi:Ca2+-transporting ATPase